MAIDSTPEDILRQITLFLSEVISQADFRHRLYSSFRRKSDSCSSELILKPLDIAAETIDTYISGKNSFENNRATSSLRLTEKLLISYPHNSFSSFLLSLIYAVSKRPIDAALSLLDVFILQPSLARMEIAPSLFEELFLVHTLPALERLNERRMRILSPLSANFSGSGDDSIVIPSSKSLSKMNGNQTTELKQLQREYEMVMDENCGAFARYLKEVLGNRDGRRKLIKTPSLILTKFENGTRFAIVDDVTNEEGAGFGSSQERYNPMWTDQDKSVEFFGSGSSSTSTSGSKTPPYLPMRVSLRTLRDQKSAKSFTSLPSFDLDLQLDSSSDDDISISSSSESEAETQETNKEIALLESRKLQIQERRNLTSVQSNSDPMADTDNSSAVVNVKHTPPKDFVCPITSHLFNDPVTLETGQTYERKAIQEWLERGNSTCPITRHKLQSTQLPKTNYVLKRLTASWQEDHPGSAVTDTAYALQVPESVAEPEVLPAVSPNSVISQATIDGTVTELRHAIDNLCTYEILEESEMAVLRIERFWREITLEVEIQLMLSKPSVINGFVEILFNSVDPQVLKATIFLLTELGSRDNTVIQVLTQVDSDVEDIITLFKKGLPEAVVLIYLLRPSFRTLIDRDMVESLVTVIKMEEEHLVNMCLKPKTAAVLLLAKIIRTNEETDTPFIVNIILGGKVIEKIAGSLEAENSVERNAAVSILLRCMQCDGKCRSLIADKAELASILESFIGASEADQSEIVKFLSELVRLNRRTFIEQTLHVIKDEGSVSTMHSLLVYLQTAPPEQSPVVASLLLQLDLLIEPRKMSIYREEAIDTLISCLRSSEHPATQILAAETIVSLQGRFTSSGESLTRDLLLKRAGLERSYKNKLQTGQHNNITGESEESETMEEEKAADQWERKTAFVLVSHEFGLLFEALAEGLRSRYTELRSSCFVAAIWLIHMLGTLPDTGVLGAARVCLLKRIMTVFNTARDIDDRVLSLLALNSFTKDPEGVQDMSSYVKDLMKGLRELRKSSPLALEMLKLFSKGHDSGVDIWQHKELFQVDCSANGEVLSIVCFKERIFSGHSDGTIKVWTGKGSILHLIQETREHSKAVTSLAYVLPGEKLYSGSLDKTTRVWSISNDGMHCVQVHDMKEQVHNLAVASTMSCYIPQGAGVKVHSWNGGSRLLNPNKYMKCLVLVQGKLYCGCQDSSIQEVDLASGTLSTIQSGSRKLLTKSNPIHALGVYDGLIYSASSPLDGSAVKVWNATSYSMVGSVASTQEVRAMVVSSDLIYLGCKGGIVEVWGREKYNKIETLRTSTNSKVMCMDLDIEEEVLVAGTSDGQIQAWALS
ncbi:unnamed protein product [Rhodiola kirilowii]